MSKNILEQILRRTHYARRIHNRGPKVEASKPLTRNDAHYVANQYDEYRWFLEELQTIIERNIKAGNLANIHFYYDHLEPENHNENREYLILQNYASKHPSHGHLWDDFVQKFALKNIEIVLIDRSPIEDRIEIYPLLLNQDDM